MGIVLVSSVFVIRNGFAISITERLKQYGMLSSIGATKKQIKKEREPTENITYFP